MDNPIKIIFENESGETLHVCFEPIGSVFQLPAKKNIEINMTTDGTPFQIQFQRRDERSYVRLWEDHGCHYDVRYEGKVLEK
jgi:hypothetical protein